MKKPSRLVVALALCLLLSSSYAIRLPREFKPSTTQQMKPSISNVKALTTCRDKEHCSASSGTRGRRVGRIAREQHRHHWFPWIHEDYRGPKRHIPKHH